MFSVFGPVFLYGRNIIRIVKNTAIVLKINFFNFKIYLWEYVYRTMIRNDND